MLSKTSALWHRAVLLPQAVSVQAVVQAAAAAAVVVVVVAKKGDDGLAGDLVALGQDVDFLRAHVDKDMVALVEGVEVGVGLGAATLEVLAAHQAGVDVDVGQADGAQLLKVKIEHVAVDGVKV